MYAFRNSTDISIGHAELVIVLNMSLGIMGVNVSLKILES